MRGYTLVSFEVLKGSEIGCPTGHIPSTTELYTLNVQTGGLGVGSGTQLLEKSTSLKQEIVELLEILITSQTEYYIVSKVRQLYLCSPNRLLLEKCDSKIKAVTVKILFVFEGKGGESVSSTICGDGDRFEIPTPNCT